MCRNGTTEIQWNSESHHSRKQFPGFYEKDKQKVVIHKLSACQSDIMFHSKLSETIDLQTIQNFAVDRSTKYTFFIIVR